MVDHPTARDYFARYLDNMQPGSFLSSKVRDWLVAMEEDELLDQLDAKLEGSHEILWDTIKMITVE